MQARRGDAAHALALFWDPQGGIPRWSQILLDKIKETRTNPVRTARALALFHTAIADATIHTWEAKLLYGRLQPALLDPRLTTLSGGDLHLPSYASEHAAVAAAAATVLNYLYPGQTALVHGAPRAARAMALVGVGLADAAIACWDCKFTFWLLRPVTAIRKLVGQPFYDPNFNSVIPTPPFPAYTSGHSTFSGCAAAVLEHLFPGGKAADAFFSLCVLCG